MEWEREALQAVARVPFFVRRMVKKRVEELAIQRGHRAVTLADVRDARQLFMGGAVPSAAPAAGRDTAPVAAPASSPETVLDHAAAAGTIALAGLTQEQLLAIEEAVDRIEGYENRFFAVRVCGGAAGCPLTQVDVRSIGDQLAARVEGSGLVESMRAKIKGPVFNHHRFTVAVAGCPNNCSEPQIKDFALVAETRPGIGEEPCIECGLCVEACRDAAITLREGAPMIDGLRCVGCGDCLAACPTGTLREESRGLSVYVGGKLGRHARLAEELLRCTSEEEAYRALGASLAFTIELGIGAERLGSLLARVGLAALRKRLA